MQLEYPYQIVSFLGEEPKMNEPVYSGEHGWYAQVALKRCFKLNDLSEDTFIDEMKSLFANQDLPTILAGNLVQPERMPVKVIDITNQDEIKALHKTILSAFKTHIISRYPDRENENYYPHITAEYNNNFVISVDEYTNKSFSINNIWLLKDIGDENSQAYCKIY